MLQTKNVIYLNNQICFLLNFDCGYLKCELGLMIEQLMQTEVHFELLLLTFMLGYHIFSIELLGFLAGCKQDLK